MKSKWKPQPHNLLRRTVLYGACALVVACGLQLQQRLESRAEASDLPYQSTEIQEGNLRRPLYDVLTGAGADPQEAVAISRALSRRLGLRSLNHQDSYRIVFSTQGAFMHLTLVKGLTRYVVSSQDGGLRVHSQKIPLKTRRLRRSGVIKDSLWMSMSSQGISDQIIAEFADTFQWTIDFLSEPREGDYYVVAWDERRSPDGRLWGRKIQSAIYHGDVTGKKVAILFNDNYYDENGDSLERMFLRAPLTFQRISSYFQKSRFHPILRRYSHHQAIDYAAPRGTPVVSVGDGRVIFSGRKGGYGRMVEVRHSPTYSTLYGHLNQIPNAIRDGVKVRQAQVIGFVGSTGLATGPHLHFEIKKNGARVNFLTLKLPFAHSVKGKHLKEFKLVRNRQLSELQSLTSARSSDPGFQKN